MNLAHILKHVTDALWLAGGIGATAELGLEGIGPEDFGPDTRGPDTRGPDTRGPGAPDSNIPGPEASGLTARNQGGNRCSFLVLGGGPTLKAGHA